VAEGKKKKNCGSITKVQPAANTGAVDLSLSLSLSLFTVPLLFFSGLPRFSFSFSSHLPRFWSPFSNFDTFVPSAVSGSEEQAELSPFARVPSLTGTVFLPKIKGFETQFSTPDPSTYPIIPPPHLYTTFFSFWSLVLRALCVYPLDLRSCRYTLAFVPIEHQPVLRTYSAQLISSQPVESPNRRLDRHRGNTQPKPTNPASPSSF
jgi:hypothetical protein